MLRSKKDLQVSENSLKNLMTSSPKRERSLDSEGKVKTGFDEMSKSKYISLYTKTRVGKTLESLDLSVNPTLEGER